MDRVNRTELALQYEIGVIPKGTEMVSASFGFFALLA